MPVIYGTDELKRMYVRLVEKHPGTDVVILTNSVMAYSFDAGARAIWRVCYPTSRPRDRITLAANNVQNVVGQLVAKGLKVAVCDLDAPPPNEYVGRSLYAPKADA